MVTPLKYNDLVARDRFVWSGINIYTPRPVPSFDDEQLKPLQVKQAQEALEAAQRAEAERVAAEQAQAIQTPQNAPELPRIALSDAKLFIYSRESGNNPKAQNGAGCLGLGQACPGSKLLAVCPNLDYACEDAFFTSYAVGRYGSWEAAAAFWSSNGWW